MNGNNLTYLDSFVVEHIPKDIKKIIGNRSIIKNTFRIDCVICEYIFMLLILCWNVKVC